MTGNGQKRRFCDFDVSENWPSQSETKFLRHRIRQRYEAWWEGEMLDRPLVRVTAPIMGMKPDRNEVSAFPPVDEETLFEWITDPEQVLPRLEQTVAATYYAGDAFPWLDPVSLGLAAIQAAYLGAPYRIECAPQKCAATLTGWAGAAFEDWSTRPRFRVDPENRWWQATQRLLEVGARRGAGCYAISLPDLQGGGEVLALLRGSERLALDLVDCPEEIKPALEEINVTWLHYFHTCYEIIHRWQEGYVDWLGFWSDVPAVTVECDFSVMISPAMFERHFLPAVAQQIEWVGRTIFHLDGPGAIPHLDALLALPKLRAIQWVPPPGRLRTSNWLPLLQRIQTGGKGVVVACEPDELLLMLDALNPRRVALSTTCATPTEAEQLVERVERMFGVQTR